MIVSEKKFYEVLVTPGHITGDEFKSAIKESKETGSSLETILVNNNLISDENMGRVISSVLEIPFVDLHKVRINPDVVGLIPEPVAFSKGIISFAKTDEGIKIAMIDPTNFEMKKMIEKLLNVKVIVYYITQNSFNKLLGYYKSNLANEITDLIKRLKKGGLTQEDSEELVVHIVDSLIEYAYYNNASDIHIEPYENYVLVRYRVDGILHDFLRLDKELHLMLLTRIKILSKLRTDEHRAAQDGKIRYKTKKGKTFDIRVSIVPVIHGENIVMRILADTNKGLTLNSLGLSGPNLESIKKAIQHPHGMVLVTGPTGSGKTTTLYSMLNILNKKDVHISTIEDPVEYDIDGISQIQVNPKTNLTFAKGLRALVRQDPDIIMVGEIRDAETAQIAVNSALTGHLVLSTLHTNDAATAVARLIDMDVEPFLVASTVNIIIAQRLARKICNYCIMTDTMSDNYLELLAADQQISNFVKKQGYKNIKKVPIYRGKGCEICGNTGYSGRIGVFEVLVVDDDVKSLIMKRESSNIIVQKAREKGMEIMFEDGLRKVISGETTLEEVIRVTTY